MSENSKSADIISIESCLYLAMSDIKHIAVEAAENGISLKRLASLKLTQ